MKTIGTLEEIGAQVGDVVNNGRGSTYTLSKNSRGCFTDADDGEELIGYEPVWRIVTSAAKSPVSTVTRKEIVPGVYGRVTAERLDNYDWCFEVKSMRIASDLTAAIKTLTEIRDAMENP